jgi:integrase
MASNGKLPTGSYRVQYYVDGKKCSKTFKTRSEAKTFAARIELSPEKFASRLTFADCLKEYRDTVTIKKKGAREESIRINRLLKYPFASVLLSELTAVDIQSWVDQRGSEPSKNGGTVSPATVRREYCHVIGVLNYAVRKGFIPKSPAVGIRLPAKPDHRERVATEEEIERLKAATGWDGVSVPDNLLQSVILAFVLSCQTGMRAGEILKLEHSWIDGRVIHLPAEATKTSTRRDVALTREAARLIELAINAKKTASPKIFEGLTDKNRDALWRKARDRAGLGPLRDSQGREIREGLNFHDGRATFATWAASPDPRTGAPRLDVLALARQTGHRDLKMLQKYYRATAEEIAMRLDAAVLEEQEK